MYKREFDRHIQNKTLSNSFLFFGESRFLIDVYTKMVSNIENANMLTYYYDEYNFISAKAHLSQGSLFGDRNILIVKREKKIPKKELDTLIELCEKNPDNIFIYSYYGSDHKSYNNKKAFANTKLMSVRFFHPKEYESQNILLQIAREKGVKIGKYTLAHLLKIHNGDIALSANELDKFRVYDREITTKDVDNLVYGLAEVNLEDFIIKLLTKQEYKKDLKNLLEHGEDEIRILSSITSYLTQLYMFHLYIHTHGAPNAIDILGYKAPDFVLEQKTTMARKLKPQTYFQLHQLLLLSELEMKSSHIDKSAILFSTLIQLQNLI